jgi:hypothetical protein
MAPPRGSMAQWPVRDDGRTPALSIGESDDSEIWSTNAERLRGRVGGPMADQMTT